MTYSIDLRERVVGACDEKRGTRQHIATLADVGMYEPIDITIGDNGFMYSYQFDLAKHEIYVTQKQLGFSYNRFKLGAGIPRDIAPVHVNPGEVNPVRVRRRDKTEPKAVAAGSSRP